MRALECRHELAIGGLEETPRSIGAAIIAAPELVADPEPVIAFRVLTFSRLRCGVQTLAAEDFSSAGDVLRDLETWMLHGRSAAGLANLEVARRDLGDRGQTEGSARGL